MEQGEYTPNVPERNDAKCEYIRRDNSVLGFYENVMISGSYEFPKCGTHTKVRCVFRRMRIKLSVRPTLIELNTVRTKHTV